MIQKKRSLKIERNGAIKDQDGNVVGALLPDAPPEVIAAIEASGELTEAAKKFVEEPSKLRGAVKTFEEVIEKHDL